jgi:molybdopterin molybdotransferase
MQMISIHEAKQVLERALSPAVPVDVRLEDAAGLVLAAAVSSGTDVPPFDNAAMDGYAFHYAPGINDLPLAARIRAGQAAGTLATGTAARIFTGAALPSGADTVVPQEIVTAGDGRIRFESTAIRPLANVRKRGSQNRQGERLADAGEVLSPGLTGLLASAGTVHVTVYPRPRVAVIATGEEIQEPGEELLPGHIYNSNGPAVDAYLETMALKSARHTTVGDDRDALKAVVQRRLEATDVLLLTGGVSVGDHDHVRSILEELGAEILFHRVNQKPGKPLLVCRKNDQWIFGLPGNPAAVITCFNQYVRPVLRGLMGFRHTFLPDRQLPLAQAWHRKGRRPEILRARAEDGVVTILGGQESFNLLSFREANCFVIDHGEGGVLVAGSLVDVYAI